MAIKNQILSIIVQEQQSLASTLSAEAIKASQTAYWLTQISVASVLAQPVSLIIQEVNGVQNAVSCVIRSTADKEVAIAAKINAILGTKSNICWTQSPCPTSAVCDCPSATGGCFTTESIITNGDFETGNLSGWVATNATVVTVPQFSGTYVAQLNTTTTGSISQTVPITGGCPIRFTFATTAQNVNPTLTVSIIFLMGATPLSTQIKTINYDNPNTFYSYNYLFAAPANADNVTIQFTRNNVAGQVWIDNVTFI